MNFSFVTVWQFPIPVIQRTCFHKRCNNISSYDYIVLHINLVVLICVPVYKEISNSKRNRRLCGVPCSESSMSTSSITHSTTSSLTQQKNTQVIGLKMHEREVHYALLKYSWKRQEFIQRKIHREENHRFIGYGPERRIVQSDSQSLSFGRIVSRLFLLDGSHKWPTIYLSVQSTAIRQINSS